MFFRSNDQGLILVVEMQSAMVRATAIWRRDGAPMAVMYDAEEAFDHRPSIGNRYIVKSAFGALGRALSGASRYIARAKADGHSEPHVISDIHFILTTPWVVSEAKTISFKKGSPFKATPALVGSIIASERDKTTKAMEIIEEKVMDVRLNGYDIPQWDGKETDELSVSYAMSSASPSILRRIERACADTLHQKARIRFHSSLFLKYSGMRATGPMDGTFIIAQPHGELTDIMTTEGGRCLSIGSFPKGTASMSRDVSRAAKVSLVAAGSALTMYEEGRLDASHASSLVSACKEAAEAWQESAAKAMAPVAGHHIPRSATVVLASGYHKKLFSWLAATAAGIGKDRVKPIEDIEKAVARTPGSSKFDDPVFHAMAIHSLGS